jgi:hypothetical protein
MDKHGAAARAVQRAVPVLVLTLSHDSRNNLSTVLHCRALQGRYLLSVAATAEQHVLLPFVCLTSCPAGDHHQGHVHWQDGCVYIALGRPTGSAGNTLPSEGAGALSWQGGSNQCTRDGYLE